MSADPAASPRRRHDRKRRHISAQCAAGRHHLCHGTVYVWPPVDGQRFAPCECDDPDCDHGRRDRG